MEWVATIILGLIGLFFLIITYVTLIIGYRTGKFVSGAPVIGGIFVFIAFMLSPVKWLAVLALLDYGVWELPYALISEYINNKKFKSIYEEKNFCDTIRDDSQKIVIVIPERDEKLEIPYITNIVHELRYPKLLYAVCLCENGDRFILIDRYLEDREIEILSFDNDEIVLSGLKSKNREMEVIIKVEKYR